MGSLPERQWTREEAAALRRRLGLDTDERIREALWRRVKDCGGDGQGNAICECEWCYDDRFLLGGEMGPAFPEGTEHEPRPRATDPTRLGESAERRQDA